jgi:hypothetical protein
MLRKIAAFTAWAALVFIAFVTLSPVSWRPDFGHVNVERFVGFGVLALLFGLAYPRRFLLVAVCTFASAGFLEALQLIIKGRDGTLANLFIKVAGGAIGLGVAGLLNWLIGIRRKG